jgi:hypothetical protein
MTFSINGFPYGQANALKNELLVGVHTKLLMGLFNQVEQTKELLNRSLRGLDGCPTICALQGSEPGSRQLMVDHVPQPKFNTFQILVQVSAFLGPPGRQGEQVDHADSVKLLNTGSDFFVAGNNLHVGEPSGPMETSRRQSCRLAGHGGIHAVLVSEDPFDDVLIEGLKANVAAAGDNGREDHPRLE